MKQDYAIRVSDVTKIYRLYDKPSDRLKESLGLTKKKKYKEYYALSGLSFDVGRGECVGIIGTNGAGKSTILKIITGVLSPTSGNVEINGRISALLELGAGFNMEYTGIENVYLNGMMIGFSREEIDAKLDEIIRFADIGDFINQPVKTYSSGMFVRLAFAVAINIDPEILIVDEALSVGDVFFQSKCYHKFEEFKKAGKTILFVSHDLGSIQKYCTKVILLNHGKKVAEGSPKDMIDLYKKILVHQDPESLQKEAEEKAETAAGGKQDAGSGSDSAVWKEKIVINPNKNEYGNRKAEMTDFGVFDAGGNITTMLEKGSGFEIRIRVHFNQDVDDPIYAFAIKNVRGVTLTGTNSMYEKYDTGKRKAGDNVEVIYRIPQMNLQGGEYLLSLGCTGYEAGELTVYHRLYDICNISVISDKVTDGYYDLYPELEVKTY